MRRGSHSAGANKTDDAGSNPVCGWWSIRRDGWQRVHVGLEGHWDRDDCEDWLAGVGVTERGEQIVCKWPRDWDCEPGGGEEEEGVGEGEDSQTVG